MNQDISNLIQLANCLEKIGKLDEAIAYYKQALALDSRNYEANQQLAEALKKQGNLTESIYYYQQLVNLNAPSQPQVTAAPVANTSIITKLANEEELLQQAQGFYQQKNWQQTITLCQTIIQLNPSFVEAYKLWGNSLHQQGNLQQALQIYSQALKINPNLAEIYANIGSIYAQQKNPQQALNFYQRAVKINPKLAAVYRNIAKILKEIGRNEQALQAIYQASVIEPQNTIPEDYYDLANYFSKQNDTNKAIASLQKVIELKPDFIPAYQQLAEIAQQQNKWEQAGNYYRKIIELQAMNAGQSAQAKLKSLAPQTEKVTVETQAVKVIINERELLQQAESFYQQKNWQQTIILCQKIIQVNPNLAEAYKLLGNTLQQNGQLEKALDFYNQALKITPNFAEVHANIGSIYAREKNWPQALSFYQRAVDINPKLAAVQRNIAKILTEIGRPEQAIKIRYQASLIEPEHTSPEEYCEIADYLLKQNQIDQAIPCLEKAVEIAPNLSLAYEKLGDIAKQKGNWEQAAKYYQKIIELKLKESPVIAQSEKQTQVNVDNAQQKQAAQELINVGNSHAQKEQWEDAISAYKKALEIQPNFSPAYHQLGLVLFRQNKFEEAKQCFQEAVNQNHQDVQSYLYLSEILTQENEIQEAIKCCLQAIEIDANNWQVHHSLGNLYLKEEYTWEEAVKSLEKAVKLNPNFSWSHHNLGEAYLKLELYGESVAAFEKAIALNPDFHWSYYNLGEALMGLEQWGKAADAYIKASTMQADLPYIDEKIYDALQMQIEIKLLANM